MKRPTNHDPYFYHPGSPATRRRQRQPRHRRGQAPVLSPHDIAALEEHIRRNSNAPEADLLKARLTYYGGLRIGEVAKLMVADLVEKDGTISDTIKVGSDVGKGGRPRQVPMHPKVREALEAFLRKYPTLSYIALSQRWVKCRQQTVTSITAQMNKYYRDAGLQGYTTHSGRRTFVTNLARRANGQDFTLRDVQYLAGHSRLDSTQAYIGLSNKLETLVGALK
jgi:integrase/recombinase XerD